MQKNPFLPPPSYNPQQPPLPPGPPPQHPPQADYSPYWPTANQNHAQQPSSGTYNSQWNPPQPAQSSRPPAEQSALYANYGYGGNQSYWQQQQRHQQPYQSPHPPPVLQPPQPPTQQYPQYQSPNAYQPQPYVPHVPGPPPVQPYQPQPQSLQAQPAPPYFPQQPRPPSLPQRQGSQQFQQPPVKRARFEGGSRSFHQPSQFPPPPNPMPPPLLQAQSTLPSYIPPPPPIQQPLNVQHRGGMQNTNRGRANKSGSVNANRNRPPGQQNNRGSFPNNQNRRNLGGNQGGSFRNQQRQSNLGGRDHGNRSFNAGQQQQGRGRNNQRSGRNDGSFTSHGSGTGAKKEDVKRAMTDFKLVAIEIKQLGWSWGVVPSAQNAHPVEPNRESPDSVKTGADERVSTEKDPAQPLDTGQDDSNTDMKAEPSELDSLPAKPDLGLPPAPHTGDVPAIPSPPSRIRIYFHTPATPKDSMPIPHASAVPVDLSTLATSQGSPRKGKRKRVDDEEDDVADNRVSHPSAAHQDDAASVTAHPVQGGLRDSIAPSVGESTSEGDWLMAAIGEDSNDGDGPADTSHPPHDSHMVNGVDNDEAYDGEVERTIVGPPDDSTYPGGVKPPGQVHATVLSDYVPSPSDDPPGLPTGDPSVDDASGAPDEQQTQQDPPIEIDREDEDESPDFVAFPDDQSSARDEDHRSASPESHVGFDYGAFTNKRLGPAASFASTIAENDSQEVSFSDYGSTLVNEDAVTSTERKDTRTAGDPARDSLSPTSTLLTTGQDGGDSASQTGETKALSANWLAISYASASRRILIDAKIVDALRVFRKEYRIEIDFNAEKGDGTELKGILVEILSDATKKYTSLQLASEAYESDPVFPPLSTVKLPSKLSLVIHLDIEKPSQEMKWVKTGDVHEWVRSTFGRIFSDASEGWEKKIVVQDPDPAPTIRSILDGWAVNAGVGQPTERQRFVKTHLSEMDNVLEILLRLIRGERATAFPQSNATVAATRNGVPGPLLAAIEDHAHGTQQTHVSLAVLAMFRMLVEFAKRADGDKGKGEVEERVGEIIRCLPIQLLHKSVEGMFKEWKTKKGGNSGAR